MTHPTTAALLPDAVRTVLEALDARDADRALAALAPDAEVLDDGHAFRGPAELRSFVAEAGAAFTYTTELTGAEQVDATTWLVRQRLVGDLPGGALDLAYRFALADGLVARLEITA